MILATVLNLVFLVGVIVVLLSFVGWCPWETDD